MKIVILSLIILAMVYGLQSCKDAFDLEENVAKDSISKKLDVDDSLSFLEMQNLDMGSIKVGSVIELPVHIQNRTIDNTVKIYSIVNTNKTGLFNLRINSQLPIILTPGEITEGTKAVSMRFIADSYTLGYYYDTLYLNYSKNFKILIKAKIKY